MTHIKIESIFTKKVLFEGEYKSTKYAVVAAVKQWADLRGADLQWAYLQGADLRGADLRGADLRGACLQGAYLRGVDLRGACLRGADLRGACLQGADLRGADLRGACLQEADLQRAELRGADGNKILLVGSSPILQIGPIGSRSDYLLSYNTEQGIYIKAGCWFGAIKEFVVQVKNTNESGLYKAEYEAAVKHIETVFKARDKADKTKTKVEV